jgi:uncharacterized protein YgbK (DUF1537 family)
MALSFIMAGGKLVDGKTDVEENELIASLPVEYKLDLRDRIEAVLSAKDDEIVVCFEDDPMGVQQSHDVYLVTDNSISGIQSGILAARDSGHRLVFILTNSRAYTTKETMRLCREIAQSLCRIIDKNNLRIRVGFRGDSTLRGHFPVEPIVFSKILEHCFGKYDGIIVTYAFLTEMRRITVDGIQLLRVRKDDGSFWYRPVHLTEFAKDERFSYSTSNMSEFIEYKASSSGIDGAKASDVLHIDLGDIRTGGPEAVREKLMEAQNGRIVVVDIVSHRDLQVLVLGILLAEREGKNYIYQTAASFPPARVNMSGSPILTRKDLLRFPESTGHILCLWGSIVDLSNTHLERVLKSFPQIAQIPLDVRKVLENSRERENAVVSAANNVEDAFRIGKHAIVYTYPRSQYPPMRLSEESKALNEQEISSSLQSVYGKIGLRPSIVLFKGGTTSGMGLVGSGVDRVYVLGQISSGVPMVKASIHSNQDHFSEHVLFIIGPGNVGLPDTYVEIIEKLTGVQRTPYQF